MELCGMTNQQHEHCNLPANHIELGHLLHTVSMDHGNYTHSWYADGQVPATAL